MLIDKALGRGIWEVSIVVAGTLVGTVFLVDKYFPWRNDFANLLHYPIESLKNTVDPQAIAWSPIIAGSIIGKENLEVI